MSDPFSFDDDLSYRPKAGGLAARAQASVTRAADYLSVLNPEQRAAVEAIDGPVLVLAGAGTGKTRVLTTRIAHILATSRARAQEILAVTFTNKAAREMKERIGVLAGPAGEGMPWLGTFHSISTKILRRHAELVGLKSQFTILDTDDQIRLLKQVIKANDVDEKRWPARTLAHMIDGWKNRGLEPARVPAGEATSFAIFWSTNIKTRIRFNIYGCACSPKPLAISSNKMSAAWGMTISRSMVGAALRSITSCALKKIFRAPLWCAWSVITDQQVTF